MVLEGSAASHAVLGRLRSCWFQMPPGPEGPRLRAACWPQASGCCGDAVGGAGLVHSSHPLVDSRVPRTEQLQRVAHFQETRALHPRSGCRVGPAGTDTAVASQRPSPTLVCPLGAHLVLFSPMGSDCDCPLPALGAGVTRLPGRRDLLPRAGPGLAPLLGHRQSGAVAHMAPRLGAWSAVGGWARRQ